MIDPVKILKRAWYILWSYRALWVFGLILAIAAGGSSSQGSNNSGTSYEQGSGESIPTPQSLQEALRDAQRELSQLFQRGIPEADITGQELTTFLWVIGAFVLVSRGEDRAGGRSRDPLLSSAFEAILGAIYLDRGFRAAQAFVNQLAQRDLSAFVWTSTAGQEIARLPAGR